MENRDDLLSEIDLLILDIKKCIESSNAVELDILKRKATIISEEALGKGNLYIKELSGLNFLNSIYGPNSFIMYRDDFIMDSGKFKNIVEEMKFKIERNNPYSPSGKFMISQESIM